MRRGRACMAVGAALLLAALALAVHNSREARMAQEAAQAALAELAAYQAATACQAEPVPAPENNSSPESPPPAEPVVEIDGCGYIGTVAVPSVGLEQPVQDGWDAARLKRSPCRQFGSCAGGDLVIAGHNYRQGFGLLHGAAVGDEVLFTDAAGREVRYRVAVIETLEPTEVDRVAQSGYALVLYTCRPGGRTRLALFCEEI